MIQTAGPGRFVGALCCIVHLSTIDNTPSSLPASAYSVKMLVALLVTEKIGNKIMPSKRVMF